MVAYYLDANFELLLTTDEKSGNTYHLVSENLHQVLLF